MDGLQWIIFILIIQVIHFLGTWKLYVKAGRKAWEAAIPIYNAIVLMQIINRPKWWVILLFIPVINLLLFPVVWVETIRSFGRTSLLDTWLVILTLGLYIYYVNYALDVTYVEERSLDPKSVIGEWVSSIVFAIVAATLVHTYFIQPYVIPTGSLERTLRIGDLLFVSKFHYGARIPMTPVAAPMVHDTLPVFNIKSYLNKPQLPYMRLPGFKKINRKEIVVFSWPADTVRQFFIKEKGVKKPIDKKSNYVKRCVGIPGDSIKIIDGYVYANGKQLELPDRAKPQFEYMVHSSKGVSSKLLLEVGSVDFRRKYTAKSINQQQFDIIQQFILGLNQNKTNSTVEIITKQNGIPVQAMRKAGLALTEITDRQRSLALTEEMVAQLRSNPSIDSVVQIITPKGERDRGLFPQSPDYPWNYSHMGSIYIPEAGKTVDLNLKVLPLYKKIIQEYEKNEVKVSGNQILLNGEVANSYTFKQDYYWMMGDNRDHSEDSRAWGYVPENHIVGTPIFIWMSFDNFTDIRGNPNSPWKWKPRWDRIFTTVNGTGEPVSYFKYFLIALVAWFGFDFFRKKRKG